MIVHLVSDRLSVGGGMEHIFQIVRGLPDVRFRIFALLHPVSPDKQCAGIEEKFRGQKNVEIDSRGFKPTLVLAGGPDLIHIHHLRPLFEFYKMPLKKYPVPVVFTAHGLHLHKFEFHDKTLSSLVLNNIKYRLRFFLEKRLFSRIERVIAVSREDQDFMEKNYGLKNVVYLTNGIKRPEMEADDIHPSRLRKQLNLPEGYFLFITVARFDFQKGYDFLVRVIGSMKDFLKQRKVGFVFVGNGPEMRSIKLLARKLLVAPYIFFMGERSDALAVMKAGDAFLLPSRWEGLPIVLLECGFLRVPVIASDTYGNREIIGKQNGVLFENLNKEALATVIRKAVNGAYDFKRMTDMLNKEVRKNYSLEKMITGLKKIYNSFS